MHFNCASDLAVRDYSYSIKKNGVIYAGGAFHWDGINQPVVHLDPSHPFGAPPACIIEVEVTQAAGVTGYARIVVPYDYAFSFDQVYPLVPIDIPIFVNGGPADPTALTDKDKANGGDHHDCQTGMASYFFRTMLASLAITDTPLTYRPAFGPAMDLSLTYNHRSVDTYTNGDVFTFGQRWSCDWLDFVTRQRNWRAYDRGR